MNGSAVNGGAINSAAQNSAAQNSAANPGWLPCSDRSAERADPLAGSAGFGERWFLVEIDGAWGAHAFLQSRLEPGLARSLVTRIEGAGILPLAIRRTGRTSHQRRAQTEWTWAAVDCRPGRESVRWGSVPDPAQLLEVPLDGSLGQASAEPLICVCAHARHDQCCAVKGRPVVTELAREYPDATWECSHLGGDRFAATMILFPHGLNYGRVPAADAREIVDAYRDGRVVPRWFRGRSSLPNAVQAAAAQASAACGDDRIDALELLSCTRSGGAHTVRFAHAGEQVTVRLVETLSPPLLSTCSATVARPVRQFRVLSVDPHGTPSTGGE